MDYDYTEYGYSYIRHKHSVVFICTRIITLGYLSNGNEIYWQDTLGM